MEPNMGWGSTKAGKMKDKCARGTARRPGGLGVTIAAVVVCCLGFCSSVSTAGAAACPNEAVRTGPSAVLPDCRAYELVSPPDADGRLLQGIIGFNLFDLFPTDLANSSGDKLLYMTYDSPFGAPGEPTGVFDLYETQRSAGGWQNSRLLSPSGAQGIMPQPGGVSSDLRYAFTHVAPIAGVAGALGGEKGADYLGDSSGSFEMTGVGSLGTERLAQGRYITPGGEHVIFTTGGVWCESCTKLKLEPDAPQTGTAAVYDRSADGPTHTVSLLPGDVTPAVGQGAEYQGASTDGSSIAFKIAGILYVRVDGAATREVTSPGATFAGFSKDGKKLFYVSGGVGESGNIYEFDVNSEATKQVNSSADAQVVNVSADGSHVYFTSPSQLDGTEGVAGQPNMYVWSEAGEEAEFIATVLPSDLQSTSGTHTVYPALSNWTGWVVTPNRAKNSEGVGPGADSSRSTPDGSVLIFESRAQLTAYENEGHTEIYRYDDQDKSLVCASCDPSDGSPSGDARLENLRYLYPPIVVNNVSEDGSRVFFESPDALVSGDTDAVNDIYEWQKVDGGGASLALISSGHSVEYPTIGERPGYVPEPNAILAITPQGADVIFSSNDQLLPKSGGAGTQAIYDARVGGGFLEPSDPQACSEEGCRAGAAVPPSLQGPQSESPLGKGNVARTKAKPGCHRGRVRKRHCPKRQAKQRPGHRRSRAAKTSASGSYVPPKLSDPESGGDGLASEAPRTALQKSAAGPVALGTPGEFEEFGIESVAAELSTAAAGRHPDFTTSFILNHHTNKAGRVVSDARVEKVSVSLPPGLIGDPSAIPRCTTGEFVAVGNCPIDSQVGISKARLNEAKPGEEVTEPLYNLALPHPRDEVARFGFFAGLYPVFIDIKVRTAGDYGVTAIVHAAPAQQPLLAAATTLWGNPASPSHDELRLTTLEAQECATACKAPGGKRSSGLPPTVFMTNSSACQEGELALAVTSYQLPGQVFSAPAPLPSIGECEGLPFEPSLKVEPTNHRAGAPTGLSAVLRIPQDDDPEHIATSTMREAKVTLPEGMTIASGAADGLEACSDGQVGYGQEVESHCPDAAKLGSATIVSPDLAEPLHGALYQRSPGPRGQLFRVWLVSDEFGLHIKLPGEIKADEHTGQLTAVFADLPQVPVEEIDLEVWGGPRAPLKNPDSCGAYATNYSFVPWSQDPAFTGQSQMHIDEGCGARGFSPKLSAGVTQPVAGAFSPLVLDLAREDGEDNLGGVEITLPKGELARLAGVPLCPDSAAASGACPGGSKIGSVTVAAGPGPQPLWIPQPGKAPTAVYLAGPYKGAPYSAVTVVPAQAGPFDLGAVAVRAGLYVDPETGQATVRTDPLPQFLEGVPVLYRRVHVAVDRPGFSLNPTNCEEMATSSTLTSAHGAVAHPSQLFQVGGCAALAFKPRLSLRFSGPTKRSGNPAVRSVLTPRLGDANIGGATVTLPPSELIDNAHINNPCTRVQFNAAACPPSSVLGTAKAYTPLLDKPLEGPVYFRSNGGERTLPDIVADLHGQLHIVVVGFVDSRKARVRTRFLTVPDAPVSKFVLSLYGGRRGLLENNRDLCKRKLHVSVNLTGQNGRRYDSNPPLQTPCGR